MQAKDFNVYPTISRDGQTKSSRPSAKTFAPRRQRLSTRRPAWMAKPQAAAGWNMRVLSKRFESVQKGLRQVLAELLTDPLNNSWSARQLLDVCVGTDCSCVPGTPMTKSIGTHERLVVKACINVRICLICYCRTRVPSSMSISLFCLCDFIIPAGRAWISQI